MLFSIVVPVYNRREELKRCLKAVQRQHYKNFEVLIIDDKSEIPIKDVIEDLKDKRFRYYQNNKNGGPYNARTIGWEKCKGDVVVNLDSDWEPFPWMLERAKYYFEKFPHVSAVTGMFIRNEDSKMFVRVSNRLKFVTPEDAPFLPGVPDCLGFVKKHVIKEWLQKSHDYFATESHAWLTFSLKHTQLYVDEPWAIYYTSSPHRVTQLTQKNNKNVVNRIVKDHLLFLKDHHKILSGVLRPDIDRELVNRFMFLFIHRYWKGVKYYTFYMKKRKMNPLKVICLNLLKKFLNRLNIFRKENSLWL